MITSQGVVGRSLRLDRVPQPCGCPRRSPRSVSPETTPSDPRGLPIRRIRRVKRQATPTTESDVGGGQLSGSRERRIFDCGRLTPASASSAPRRGSECHAAAPGGYAPGARRRVDSGQCGRRKCARCCPGGHEDSVLQRAGALLVPTVSAGSRQPGQPVVMAVARSWPSSSGAGSGLCASLLGHHIQ